MSTYLFDTSAYSHLVKGHPQVAAFLQEAEIMYIPHIAIAELRYGFAMGTRQQENEKLLARFLASRKVRVVLPDNATTDYFVQIATHARQHGVQLSSHDLWIAALAEQWGVTVVTFDKDFCHLAYQPINVTLLK